MLYGSWRVFQFSWPEDGLILMYVLHCFLAFPIGIESCCLWQKPVPYCIVYQLTYLPYLIFLITLMIILIINFQISYLHTSSVSGSALWGTKLKTLPFSKSTHLLLHRENRDFTQIPGRGTTKSTLILLFLSTSVEELSYIIHVH